MTGKTLLICTREKDYARRLAEYIAGKKEYMFSVHYCDSVEQGWALAREREIDYLLIDAGFSREERRSLNAKRCFVLTGHPDETAEEGEIPVFKYRSGREILENIAAGCIDDRELLMRRQIRAARIVGFYSPVTRLGQTELALGVGKNLAREDSVLYLNLCAYASGGHFREEEAGSLEDLIYYIRQDAPNMGARIRRLAGSMEGLDYLEPVTRRDDLAEVSAEEWQKMLDVLEESAGYGVILLDLGECVQGITEILKRCRHIFMPVLSDRYSEAKTEAFLTEMREAGEEVMVRGIRPVTMDQDEERLIAACSELIAHAGGRP